MKVGSLRLRLLLAGVLSIALALMLSAAGLVYLFERHVERRVDAELNVHLVQLVAGLDRNAAGEIALVQPPAEARFDRPMSGLYWQILIEPSGPVLRSRSLWDMELVLPQDGLAEGLVRRHRLGGPAGAMLYLLERRLELPERLERARIRAAVGIDTTEISQAVSDFVADLTPFLLVIGALLSAAAWAQVMVGLRPLAAVRHRLTAIRSGNEQRLRGGFPDEVKPLAVEIDALLDARDIQIDKARARAADLAHGLKTPLQVLNAEVDRLQAKGEQEIAAALRNIAGVMHRHIERELTRARLAPNMARGRADVRDVAQRVINVMRRTPNGQHLTWSVDIPGNLTARMDADDLYEALGNLIENAASHARSRVEVSGRMDRECALITVTDDGPGIPAERLAEALSRGGRLDASGPGAGLGLAIVSEIAEAWDGDFTINGERAGAKANLRVRGSLDGSGWPSR
jgi:signal transduction histidine kinase